MVISYKRFISKLDMSLLVFLYFSRGLLIIVIIIKIYHSVNNSYGQKIMLILYLLLIIKLYKYYVISILV